MPGILCEHCTAACCRYIALPLDTPETRADFDDLRWFLIHEHVAIFVEEGDWYIAFQTTCRHLLPDNRCGIYETRPQICRKYSVDDCDYHSGDYGWEQHFTNAEHLDAYLRQHPPRDTRNGTRPKRRRARGVDVQRRRAGMPAGATADRRGVALPLLPFDTQGPRSKTAAPRTPCAAKSGEGQ